MAINLPILDWLQQFFAKLGLVGSILVPAGITAVAIVLYFAVSDVKTSRKIVKPKTKKTEETEGMELEGVSEEQKVTLDDGSLENRERNVVLNSVLKSRIQPPELNFNGSDENNQKMIDASFAYYVSMALINSAPSARIHTEVKSRYGQIRTVDDAVPQDFKAQLKEAIKEVGKELMKEESSTNLSVESQAPPPMEEQEVTEEATA